MSYDVKGSDVDALYEWLCTYTSELTSQLTMIGDSLTHLVNLESFKGEAAESSKAYFAEVHGSILIALLYALEEVRTRYAAYMQPYFSEIDYDKGARFGSEALIRTGNHFSSCRSDIASKNDNLSRVLRSVSDLVPTYTPSLDSLDTALFECASKAKTLDDRVSAHESWHANQANSLDSLISTIQEFMSVAGTTNQGGNAYVSGSAFEMPSFVGLANACNASGAYIDSMSDYAIQAHDAFIARVTARLEDKQLAQREQEGWMQIAGAAVTLLVGAVVCIATLGAATPVVAAATAIAFGACAAFQYSEMYEGSEKIRLARKGDLHTQALNPVRDYVFAGNSEAYEIGNAISIVAADVIQPVGLIGGALRIGGKTAAKAVTSGALKGAVKEGASVLKNSKGVMGTLGTIKKATGTLDASTFGIKIGKGVDFQGAIKGTSAKIGSSEKSGTAKIFPLKDAPYIRNGKAYGRPKLWGKKKLEFEKAVYERQVGSDGILRDPSTGEVIDWKPGQPRKGKVDFGHDEGKPYSEMFEKYKNGEIDLDALKEFQFNPDNFRIELPSANRSHLYE